MRSSISVGGHKDEDVAYHGRQRAWRAAVLATEKTREDEAAELRERTRRSLIWRHMHETTGAIHWHLVHQWPYQPSEADIDAAIAELDDRRAAERARYARYAAEESAA